MNKSFIIIPPWPGGTYDGVFKYISSDLGKTAIATDRLFLLTRFSSLHRQILYASIALFKCLLAYFLRDKDIRNVAINGINLGHCVNERCVSWSRHGFASLALIIKYSLLAGCKYSRFISFYQQNCVSLVLAGDEAYIDMSICLQLANKQGIPAFCIKGFTDITFYPFDSSRLTAYPESKNFRCVENILDNEALSKLFAKYNLIIKSRVDNDRTDLAYMTNKRVPITVESESSILRQEHEYYDAVWLFQHDFFDSPGVYGKGTLFKDHYTWFDKTLEYCDKNRIKVIVKAHPNNRPKSLDVLHLFQNKYRSSSFISFSFEDIPLSLISRLRPSCICSVYGSVIPEATYLGIPVITCGPNPYQSYQVSNHAVTHLEYFSLLNIAAQQKLKTFSSSHAIKALALSRQAPVSLFMHISEISYDDLSSNLWQKAGFDEPYPDNIEVRRKYNINPRHSCIISRVNLFILKEQACDFSVLLSR